MLFINEAFAKDAGHYVVIARNPKLGENKCSCQVIVKVSHSFSNESRQLIFSCKQRGSHVCVF